MTIARLLHASTALIAVLLAATPLRANGDICTAGPEPAAIPSLVVNDPAVLDGFGFARTVGAILASQGAADTPANREGFVRTMLSSFNATRMVNPESGLEMTVDRRDLEAALDPAELLDPAGPDGLHPVGLFNRLDLAPKDFSNCGEHRVVYSMRRDAPSARFFLIFEARVANPQGTGREGCLPVAEFWSSLTGMSGADQAEALQHFYYDGLGDGFGPVIQARNFGQPDGQVRGNVFVGFTKWQLREWLVGNFGAAGGSFVPVTVKVNPLAELYADASGDGSPNPVREEAERTAFLQALRDEAVGSTLVVDLAQDNAAFDDFERALIGDMGASLDGRFDEFQSDSQGNEDVPLEQAPPNGRARGAVSAALAAISLPHGRMVTAEQALNRLGVATCGGCHQFSNDVPIGTMGGRTVNWPPSAFFVHIEEDGALSPALTDFFLPARLAKLKEMLCSAMQEPSLAMQVAEREATTAPAPNGRAGAVDEAAAAVRAELEARGGASIVAADEEPSPALRRYLETVERLRQDERDKPGAFTLHRRVH